MFESFVLSGGLRIVRSAVVEIIGTVEDLSASVEFAAVVKYLRLEVSL